MKTTETPGVLKYPAWKYLMYALIDEHKRTQSVPASTHAVLDDVMQRLSHVREIIQNYHPAKISLVLGEAQAHYIPKESLNDVLERLKLLPVASNEFYAGFDMRRNDFTIVDPKIADILGIEPRHFNIRALLGLDPESPLAHPQDVNHWIRWGSLAYMMLCMPVFSYESMRVCFHIKFRINTSKSQIPALRQQGVVMLDQRAYPHFETDESGVVRPTYHLDHWSVFPATEEFVVTPFCTTDLKTQSFTNALLYLLNAYMMDVPVKYLLLLNERMNTDRNKDVAQRLNEKIAQATGLDAMLDDTKVGNYFAKTIRTAIFQVNHKWNPGAGIKNVGSDHEAIAVAKMLGLLPIHPDICRLAVAGVTDE
ncbi:MAG: hypothetical protein JNM00_09810 [Flavobacteriales bacterium]|nr:hypothetical protein [Flavobacteriales bacterium]